ncbi:2-keto-4-pentenoate hydratase/2-oxohepta-3-ene-1,7-dioic acid hydratase (catechol pathway) [Halopelagius inordinatus]|uniref:2-keto-4-pentenoate hydratase/2-oxohepta-3-ene-1,7-dioic acid hydratase (Catechol pathway) n=1 Tax=Halopelagius inordinatus TaxID=553467 RepID=A0A1I2VA53_9EURY|nr:fumarylacetoacetate hydrolase family protein [Halopelagius inordinatus]SFG86254.1 2-keto-4-pentenoate hydratase/2-oxohepta-3-ene-1,7-dioic acid hydratase (catechol pathway) [Halopelagius inordinatus]
MHRVRFRDPAGSVRTGRWTDDGLAFGGETFDPDDVDVLPPCEPTKIVCVGLNYAKHAAESGMDIPDRPLLFLKPPNALAAHGDTVTLPAGKERVDYEAELAVVIGEQCRNVSEDEAMDYVAGFTCLNDISNRDDQDVEQNWIRGKAFDNSAPLGPVLATPDEVPDDASIELRVNGETKQDSSRADFIFSIPELVAEITEYMTLEPGDVISTGTPEGVGPLSGGDRVEIDIEGIGVLEHTVRED